jgi:hypothetical protein
MATGMQRYLQSIFGADSPVLQQAYGTGQSRTDIMNQGYQPGGAPGYGTSTDPEGAGFNLFGDARAWLAANPQIWSPYGGQMTAGLSPWTQTAAGGAAATMGYTPQQVQAGSFTSGDLGAYMNPYLSNVVDLTMSDIDRSRQIANQQGARSAGASTYGGDRNALIEAETNRGYADVAARTSAQLRSQGFDTAAGLMSQDMNRSLTAGLANQTAGLQGNAINLQGAGMLGQFGMQDQATNQAGLDAAYNEYLRSTYGPMEGYNFLGGLLSGSQYATPGGPGAGRSALGAGLSGAAIGSAFGPLGAGIGAGAGLLGGWLFG